MPDTAPHDVCIVGAGISGLNALVVASGYLPRSGRAVLVDSRPQAGGMWVDTYDYVRLHQPHPIFTAGNIKWQLEAAPAHLASKPEVLDHLGHCLEVAKARIDVDERFGWSYVGHAERDGVVDVELRAPDGSTHTVVTRRLVKAFGHQVEPNPPLTTTSARVRSVTPETLDLAAMRADDSPVWIVGGGKTAMDTAYRIITEIPGRDVHLLAGPGTIFARRDTFFPTGAKRWWGGTPINTMAQQVNQRFDGTNEEEVRDWFRSTYGLSPVPGARDFFSGYLSEAENQAITRGLRTVEREYFVDAVDRGDSEAEGVDILDRKGTSRHTPAGSWIVNCTGSLLRSHQPYEPYASESGNVLSLQMRSSTFGAFSPFAGYYMAHLMFRDKLRSVPLYELDIAALHGKAAPVVIYASMALTLHNLSLIIDALPKKVLMQCGLDYNLWYPIPRQLAGVTKILATHHRTRARARSTLDTLAVRFDVRSGALPVA
ncbi:MAG TPA: hypothetical protein VFK41_02260 [Nocardioidaceae bacterium]|nr:hypothetical protein [Nocardioidaceae bacterium]